MINDKIKALYVILITDEGEQKGQVPFKEALAYAQSKALDLVQVLPGEIPTCRVKDYGKSMFSRNKKNTGAKHKNLKMKEVKFSVSIQTHDYQVKLNHLKEFLEAGHKAKISLKFRGREIAHKELGDQIMENVKRDVADYAVVESDTKLEGRICAMVLSPAKNTKKSQQKAESKDA